MSKFMIHTYPKREWYVLNYLVPSMIKQGINKDDIIIISDREGIGNLESWLSSLKMVKEDTWHLQDDIVICSDFKARTEVLDYLKTIVCGFVHYDFNTGSTLCTGFTIPKFMFMSFPCIFIPKKYSDDFLKWFYTEKTQKNHKKEIDSKKNDDLLFYKFILEWYPDLTIYNCKPCLVDHIDYLIGGSSVNLRKYEGQQVRAYYWNEENLIKDLEKRLKNGYNRINTSNNINVHTNIN